jgi:hypothetical protein
MDRSRNATWGLTPHGLRISVAEEEVITIPIDQFPLLILALVSGLKKASKKDREGR